MGDVLLMYKYVLTNFPIIRVLVEQMVAIVHLDRFIVLRKDVCSDLLLQIVLLVQVNQLLVQMEVVLKILLIAQTTHVL